MGDTVPLKRPSPSTGASFATPAPKLARLDAPSSPPRSAHTARDEPAARLPKLATLFKKPHERDPAPMRSAEAGFIETQFDVEDAAACIGRASTVLAVSYWRPPESARPEEDVDLVIENLTLETANLLPNIFEIEARNYFKLSAFDNLGDVSKHAFWISFSQVQTDLKDVAFYIKKKTGFPRLTDSGYADVFLGGKGLSGKVQIESTGRKHHAFKVVDVKLKIDKLKFAVRDSKHSTLINLLRPLATGLIKTAVTKAMEAAIRAALEQVDAQLSDISERLDDAKNQEGTNKIDALKQSFADKKAEAQHKKQKAEELAPDGKFAVTLDPKDKLVNWSAPDSTLDKMAQTQKQARATGSDDWRSPAFTIVGAGASQAGARSNGAAAQPAHQLYTLSPLVQSN
ncbi:hypothetical protein JCM10450v2_005807 [Rhodotorula kratochvilovae]